MEFHWYEDYWTMPRRLPNGQEFYIGFYQTRRALAHKRSNIHTDQTCFVTTELFELGYRVFLHFKSGAVTEIQLDDVSHGARWTP